MLLLIRDIFWKPEILKKYYISVNISKTKIIKLILKWQHWFYLIKKQRFYIEIIYDQINSVSDNNSEFKIDLNFQ